MQNEKEVIRMKYEKPVFEVISDDELQEHIMAAASACFYVCCNGGK